MNPSSHLRPINDFDPRRTACEQGQHARCADADKTCPCQCHRRVGGYELARKQMDRIQRDQAMIQAELDRLDHDPIDPAAVARLACEIVASYERVTVLTERYEVAIARGDHDLAAELDDRRGGCRDSLADVLAQLGDALYPGRWTAASAFTTAAFEAAKTGQREGER